MQKIENKIIKKLILFISILTIIASLFLQKSYVNVYATDFESSIKHKSSVLIECSTGDIVYEKNSKEKLPIASVTKLMTTLITLEEIENNRLNIEDEIVVSENASGMGGSQIFLDANQKYKIGELLKSVIVCSANDSSVALAEHIAGSEQNFVKVMNEKANMLGMLNTHYANCTGLPTAEGFSTAYDQAILLNKVLSYDLYHTYSSIWMEDFAHPSGRTTQMTNTNKLSRFYEGCIGGKTGSTNQAKYCLAVGAERNNTKFIAVVMGAENSKDRFKLASDLLNYGFANFESKTIFSNQNLADKSIKIKNANKTISLKVEREYSIVCSKNETPNYTINFNLPDKLKKAKADEVVGTAEIIVDGVVVDTINILSCESYSEPTIWDNFKEIIKN